MALLFRIGHCAHGFPPTGVAATAHADRFPHSGVSEFGRILHIRVVAHFLLLMTSVSEVQKYGNQLYRDNREAA
jgi:hypothetical protein